jgi:two-component system sensor histidine kinase/response regulator
MTEARVSWQFNREAALARLEGDDDLLQEVLVQFLEDAPDLLVAINSAIVRGDGPALRDAAHSLKGAAAYLAADQLCASAQGLEGFGRANQFDEARAAWPSFVASAASVIDGLRREQDIRRRA